MTTKKAGLPAKLYAFTVTKSQTFIVAARSEEEARQEARSWAHDALDDSTSIMDVDFEREVDEGSWYLDEHASDLAYGDYNLCRDRTVMEIFKDSRENPPPDESKGPVVWCDGCRAERVQWDWRKGRQLCAECEAEEGGGS